MITPRPKKLLAIKLRALGDTILMTAPLAELKRAWPSTEIHVAVTSTWAPLLENHPAITKIWKYDRFEDRAARAKSVMRLALKLRRERFDCVINFHASPSSAMMAFATGASVRSIHFHGLKDKNRHSTVEIPGKGKVKPVLERDLDAVRALGIRASAHLPEIHLLENERQEADHWIDRMSSETSPGPHQSASKTWLMIGLGASRPAKSWPLERYAELAFRWATEQENGAVLATAGPTEAVELSRFLTAVDTQLEQRIPNPALRSTTRARILAENHLSLRQLAALMTRAAVYLGNDSGPKHIAVATGCPTVTVFGPEDPFEWHPYPLDRHPYLYVDPLPCRRDAQPGMPPWCGVHECLESSPEQHRCMRAIGVESVLHECRRMGQSRRPELG